MRLAPVTRGPRSTPDAPPPPAGSPGDLRHAVRSLRRAPRFAVPLLAALALGVGLGSGGAAVVLPGLAHPAPVERLRGMDVPPPPDGAPSRRPAPTAAERLLLGKTPGRAAARVEIGEAQTTALRALLRTFAAVLGLALLVAALDAGLLVTARAQARRPEIAVRRVLGAPRRRLARLLLAESALLALGGVLAGAALGALGSAAALATWPDALARWAGRGLSPALALALLPAGVALAASAGALRPPRGSSLRGELSAGDRATTDARAAGARRRVGVVAVAASVTLLAGAGVLLRSFGSLDAASPFAHDPADTLTLRLEVPAGEAYAAPAERAAYLARLLEGVASAPGVRAAALATPGAPLGLGTQELAHAWRGEVGEPGRVSGMGVVKPARYLSVSPGYFETLGLRVTDGRGFRPRDRAGAEPVVVISETFAHRLFPRSDPLGHKVQLGGMSLRGTFYTVVGVVEEVRVPGLGTGSVPVPTLYLSALQHPPAAAELAVRTGGDAAGTLAGVRGAAARLEPRQRLDDPLTLAERLRRHAEPLRWIAGMLAAVAALSTLLAAWGLYGVIHYTVSQRTRELGIRAALGAPPRSLVRLVMREGGGVVARGMALGLAGALCLARLLEFLFHGARALDPWVYGTVAALLGGVALAASYRPARAAARVDPLVALRQP